MDEYRFQQHGLRLAFWFHIDEKGPIVRHAPTRKKIGIVGAVRVCDGKLLAREKEKFNAQTFEAFFSELFQHRDGGKLMVVVLDNARFHHAKVLSEWLGKHSAEFCLDFLPPYSPELNHIERVWKLIRRLCTHNQYFEHLTELCHAVFTKISEWASPNNALAQLCAII